VPGGVKKDLLFGNLGTMKKKKGKGGIMALTASSPHSLPKPNY